MAFLPPEVWDHILSFIDAVQDLKSIALVSNTFYCHVNATLWNSPCLKEGITYIELQQLSHLPILDLHLHIDLDEEYITNWGKAVGKLENLQILKPVLSRSITIPELKELSRLPVTVLDLKYVSYIDDEWLDVIANFSKLTCLQLGDFARFMPNITDHGLARLTVLHHLEHLRLLACLNITGIGLSELVNLPLRTLDVRHWDTGDRTPIRDNDVGLVEAITYMTGLTKLHISYNDIYDNEMVYLSSLNKLSVLDISCNLNLTWVGLRHISHLPLTEISIRKCDATDKCLEIISDLKGLRKLDASVNTNITSEGLKHLARLCNLSRLHISNCPNICSNGLKAIRNLPLTELGISNCNADDSYTDILSSFHRLRRLNLSDNPAITDGGIAGLAHLKHLLCININECNQLTSKSLSYLQHLPDLQELYIADSCDDEHLTDILLQMKRLSVIVIDSYNLQEVIRIRLPYLTVLSYI